jgi:hypothetical protein
MPEQTVSWWYHSTVHHIAIASYNSLAVGIDLGLNYT